MSRYEWPVPPGPPARQAASAGRGRRATAPVPQGEEALDDAPSRRRVHGARAAGRRRTAAAGGPANPRHLDAGRRGCRSARRSRCAARPTATRGSPAGSATSPSATDGQRLYAASALAGVWYSDERRRDRGSRSAQFAMTRDRPAVAASSTRWPAAACTSLRQRRRRGARRGVGRHRRARPGGPTPRHRRRRLLRRRRRAARRGPVHAVRANPEADPWTREAQPAARRAGPARGRDLQHRRRPGDARARSSRRPRGGSTCATRRPSATRGAWSPSPRGMRRTVAGERGGGGHRRGLGRAPPAGDRLWVAVAGGQRRPARSRACWRSDNGPAGPFVPVATHRRRRRRRARTGLLRHRRSPPRRPTRTIVYALANAPRLWRIDGDARVRRVRAAPRPAVQRRARPVGLRHGDRRRPRRTRQRIVLGGRGGHEPDRHGLAAALYRLTLRLPPPARA